MASLRGRRITVGISGGIAAYKGAELVRLLVKEEAEVQVVMTPAAERFITRMTLQALSTRPVAVELFDLDRESRIGHIEIADRAELLVIAPATADVMARLAAGMADDLLTTIALACRAPLLLAPAMNVNMWSHPATQVNLSTLVARGAHVVGPSAGDLACGWVGQGRLVEPPEIVEACRRILDQVQQSPAGTSSQPRDLDGIPLLITAGPTHEPLDPVRYLGNRSSGKMGFALARRAAARGAQVTLVAGPVSLPTPAHVERIDVESARQMRDQVLAREQQARCVIMAAAVADYRPVEAAVEKIKKGEAATLSLVLEKNPDILAELVARRKQRAAGGAASPSPLLVGFAAETGDLEAKAREKLARKGCDLLVANDVSEPGSAFGGDTNRVVIFSGDAEPQRLPLASKDDVAGAILDRVVRRLGLGPGATSPGR